MRLSHSLSRRLAAGLGASVLLLGVAGAGALSTASAAGDVADGSDWGPQGTLASTSPQTARWDNVGNSPDSVVPRDASQRLLHTDGKTYADVDEDTQAAYESYFGKDNGRGGLEVTVSQTEGLVAQGVGVTISGSKADIPTGGTVSTNFFQIFQCWGAQGPDGKPDPSATSPDPATCQFGGGGPDIGSTPDANIRRFVYNDALLAGGDWAKYSTIDFRKPFGPPFITIAGESSGENPLVNPYFNSSTTNEYDKVQLPPSGSTTRQFEIQTGADSSLGCGYRSDAPSTSSCWLVVVPRIQTVPYTSSQGAIAPSVWAQRMQFKLGFQDAAPSCPSGAAQSRTVGSELLSAAATSWGPGICEATGVSVGYTKLSDQVARSQFTSGRADAVLTSDPVPATSPATVVPLALTAPAIGYNLAYRPACLGKVAIEKVTTEEGAKACGYPDLAALREDLAKAGQPVRDLNLNALLVAKLLTMSYSQSLITEAPKPPWAAELAKTMTADPTFIALNPQLHLNPTSGDISSLVLELQQTDASTQVWRWLQSDPAAHAFLAGCPDANGFTINPFFSTRSYEGCEDRAASLSAAAQKNIDETVTPPGFDAEAPSYPPSGAGFPLPSWQQVPELKNDLGVVIRTPLTLIDWLPRVSTTSAAARDAYIGLQPRNAEFCEFSTNPLCTPAPGKYNQSPSSRQPYGLQQVFTITDAASAASYRLSTAKLCDDDGQDCVGASTDSLQAAAADFKASDVTGFAGPAAEPDYAGGAYPLAMPVYAAVKPTSDVALRASYADAFAYITDAGQVPGLESGDLPPGYAPLTPALKTQALAGIAALRLPAPAAANGSARPGSASVALGSSGSTKTKGGPSASASPSASPSDSAGVSDPAAGAGADPAAPAPAGSGVAPAPSAGAAATDGAGAPGGAAAADSTVQTIPVSAGTESWPGWLVPLALLLAILAGLAGPLLRMRTAAKP